MKRTSKKLLSLLIALLMVVSLLPVAALAVEDYGLLVNGVAVTSENAEDLSGLPGVTVAEGGWLRYDAGQNTLYAKDATIAPPEPSAMPSDYAGAVRRTSEDKLTVVSEGVNSFTADDGYSAISGLELQIALSQGSELNCFAGGFAYDESAIYPGVIGAGKEDGNDDYHSGTDLTISGPGKLNASSVIPSGSSYEYAYGILAFAGIRIDNGAIVTVTADDNECGEYALALCADYGDLTVTEAEVSAGAFCGYGDADAVYAYGNIDVTDSLFDASAGADDETFAIYVYEGDVSFDGCPDVSISAEGEYAYGIYPYYGKVLIDGCPDFTVTADCGEEYGDGYAVYAYEGEDDGDLSVVTVRDSVLTVNAYSDDDVYGIYAGDGSVDISGSVIEIEALCGDDVYGGIYGYYGIKLTDCELVDVTTYGECCSYGLQSYYGDIEIDNCRVVVDATCTDNAYGIYSDNGSVDISGSVIEIEALCGDDVYGGIFGYYGIKLTDCELVDVTTYGECCSYGLYSYYVDIEIDNCRVFINATCTDDAYGIYSGDCAVSIRASDVTVTADGVDDSYAFYACEGITITDAELVEPEGGTYGTYVYDADEEIADYVVILGYIGPDEPEDFVPGYWINMPKEITNGKATASALAAGEGAEISFTLKPDEGYLIDGPTVTDDARWPVDFTDNGDGTYTFVMPASGVWINFRFYRDLPFEDVDPDDYFYDAVAYLYDNGITKGTSETTFEPEGVCTRAEIVTLLWRMMGEPEPASAECPFEDVAPDAYYYKAVLWAVENGVTLGTSETTFEPDLKVQRAMTVTFLYRALKLKGEGFEGAWAFELDFTDKDAVPEWSYESFCWMVMNEIVQGADGKLLPLEPCTRGQIAAMLYRTLA